MQTFTTQRTVVISRQTYSGNPSKSTYSTVATTTCYLRPLTEEQASMNGYQYGLAFSTIFETNVDVREADKLTIDSLVYTVRGVVNHNRGYNTGYKRAVVTLKENA